MWMSLIVFVDIQVKTLFVKTVLDSFSGHSSEISLSPSPQAPALQRSLPLWIDLTHPSPEKRTPRGTWSRYCNMVKILLPKLPKLLPKTKNYWFLRVWGSADHLATRDLHVSFLETVWHVECQSRQHDRARWGSGLRVLTTWLHRVRKSELK